MRKIFSTLLTVAILGSISVPTANAAFPGKNGRIFFQACDDYCGPDQSDADIFSVRADGTGLKRLTHNHSQDQYPSVSPDGRKIVFNCKGGNRSSGHICVMDVDGSDRVRLTSDPDRNLSMPSWSPDGSEIVFVEETTESARLKVMDADGSNVRLLLDRGPLPISFPEWSPDGEQIVFIGTRAGGVLDRDVFKFDLSTAKETNLTQSDLYESSASWSPFGQRILYTQETDSRYDAVYSMASDGTDSHQISEEAALFVAPSPNGEALAFVGDRSGQLMRMGRDGSGVTKLTRGLDVGFPDWQPK